ncbi:MAG: DUF4249 domain-containing protein [Bacteroidetes bacterium]|nr:DUF4249 domain-containing protein [Bacteroidota bacterium]
MKSIKNIPGIPLVLSVLFALLITSGCERDITVDLPTPEKELVVEGYINPGGPAYVFISRTAEFFAPVDSASLAGYAEKNALVVVSDGIISDTLIAPLPDIGYLYISTQLTGEVGKTYSLYIRTADGKEATSTSTIKAPVVLDSVWFKVQADLDSLGWMWARLSDPGTPGNAYRWFAKRTNKDDDFISPSGSVFEDKFFNGLSFDLVYNRGELPNSTAEEDENEEDGYYKKGDTIVVKFASITKESFDFWRAAETQSSSNGNPFGSAAPLNSNVQGAIGIWEGFSYTLDTVIAQ